MRTLAPALDRDELVGFGEAGRDHTRNLVAIDLAEGSSVRELARLAIGGCYRGAAACAGGQAAVDAVAIGIVRDDEDTRFGLSGDVAIEDGRKGKRSGNGAHGPLAGLRTEIGIHTDNARRGLRL